MRRVSLNLKAILAVTFGALLGGCATTVDMGPGYYHYDTRAAGSPPAVVYEKPAVVYREAPVVYREPGVVYYQPPVVYRPDRDVFFYRVDHGQ